MRLFKAVVLDVWKAQQREAERLRHELESVVRRKRERLDRVDEAFLHERSIDQQTYERQRDQLREQIALAEIELNDAVLDKLDIDDVLAFAENVMANAARFRMGLGLTHRQQLQAALLPDGLRFDGDSSGTAVTCSAFRQLREVVGVSDGVASPTGLNMSNRVGGLLRRAA